ncbi:MAG: hypothetical protein CMJ83_19305 [Planctomycetes bacterium]|nr:hypothetical protein [Planctomycetota bacterium]
MRLAAGLAVVFVIGGLAVLLDLLLGGDLGPGETILPEATVAAGGDGPRAPTAIDPVEKARFNADVEEAQEETPLLVAGIVVDGTGRPVLGAHLYVSVNTGPRQRPWKVVASIQTKVDGKFSVRRATPAAEVQVQAGKPGWISRQRTVVTPGAGDVHIELTKTGELTGRLLLPRDAGAASVTVMVLRLPNGETTSLGKVTGDGPHEYLWSAANVPPGLKLAVYVSATGSNEGLHREEGFMVSPGTRETVPTIDLRALELCDVSVVDEESRPLCDAWVMLEDENARGTFEYWQVDTQGRFRRLAKKGVRDVMVGARSRRPQTFPAFGTHRVVLKRGPIVRFRVENVGDLPLAKRPIELLVLRSATDLFDRNDTDPKRAQNRLSSLQRWGMAHGSRTILVDDRGEAVAHLDTPGLYSVSMRVGAASARQKTIPLMKPTVRVQGHEGEQLIGLRADRTALARALEDK